MALRFWNGSDAQALAPLQDGLAWLRSRQRADGSWPHSDDVAESSWATALACCALAREDGPGPDQAVRGGRWLLQSRSRNFGLVQTILIRLLSRGPPVVDQDNRIPGWSWAADSSPWVEPTAWSLLALKQLPGLLPEHRTRKRIDQGHALLADRMCHGGGWNAGNKTVLGVDLSPYPETTAIALLALQDHRSPAVTDASLAQLEAMLPLDGSTLVLALAILALQLYERDVRSEREELLSRLADSANAMDVRTLALALLAARQPERPFLIPPHA